MLHWHTLFNRLPYLALPSPFGLDQQRQQWQLARIHQARSIMLRAVALAAGASPTVCELRRVTHSLALTDTGISLPRHERAAAAAARRTFTRRFNESAFR